MRWRIKVCEVAGYGDIMQREGFTSDGKPWPPDDPLVVLLSHSDCEGHIDARDCAPLADRLEQLLPALERAGNGGGHIDGYADKTRQFIKGLRAAAAAGENVEFH